MPDSVTSPAPPKKSQRLPQLKLDPSLYRPKPEEVAFLKSQTCIDDDEELKTHVIAVQKEAWDVVNYRCIQTFGFTSLKISRIPAYESFLQLAKERPGALYLEHACCFGNDARKAIADGWPREDVVAADIQQEFWDLGHRLFKSTPESFPVPFVRGDIFDTSYIAVAPPAYEVPGTSRPDLKALTSLTPLQGHVSAIHVSAFFHLFARDEQIYAAKVLASLLSPLPGSMIFGQHVLSEDATSKEITLLEKQFYAFSEPDWIKLWNGEIFKEGSVSVEVRRPELPGGQTTSNLHDPVIEQTRHAVYWCLKRL